MTVIEKENNDIGQNILYELYLFSEWKLEREFLQKADNIFPNGISLLRQWIKIFEPERTLIDCVTQCLLKQLNWQIALGDEGKVIAVLGDNILEIRTKRGDYSTVVARTAVVRDAYPQWRKMIWSPDCTFLAVANSNGSVGFYDLTATNLFTIPPDCSQPAGIICSDTTHALSGIVFVPCRVKNNKWASEVLLVDYKGKLRSYLISQTDGSKLIHTFNFDGGVSALTYDVTTSLLFVAGNPRLLSKNVQSAADVGITAWRVINDAPFYKLSVASDQTFNNSTDSIRYIIPFGRPTISSFVFKMAVSQDGNKLVCIHTNGDISLWRMPLLKLISLWDLSRQPAFDLSNPLTKKKPIKGNVNKQFVSEYAPADVNWWNDNAIILARYNGSVTVCDIENLQNLLEKGPQFFQGTPQVTLRFNKTFIALECETKTMSAKQLQENGDAQETSQALIEKNIDDSEEEPSYIETGTELFKSILYLITDMERFQPKPKKIRLVTRIYRLLGVKSITPDQLYARKIQNGNYTEALKLAESYSLDSDLVYQQQWRTTPVSHESIKNYLAKMKKKTWVVHQCVDRLPESLHAAKELLQFGLKVTKDEVLKDLDANISEDSLENLTIESLSSMASEMVRCRHLMLFYIKRLQLYEAIIKVEKSTYSREEYHRLRSNSIVRSAIEYAHEGRTCALFCLWPHLNLKMKLTVLDNLPETINPIDYKQLLPTCNDTLHDSQKEIGNDNSLDWCEKEVFRSLWSNLAEEISPETTTHTSLSASEMIKNWYCLRARKIEEQSGLVSYALLLLELGQDGKVQGLEILHHLLLTLTTLIYEVQNLDVTLQELENCSCLETCQFLMVNGDVETFVDDLKKLVLPYLERYSAIYGETDILQSLKEYLTELSKTDLKLPLLVLKSAADFKINVLNHLCMVEKFLFANTKTDQLPLYYAVMDTVPTESDSSITPSALLLRLSELERLLSASDMLSEHGAPLTLVELTELRSNPTAVRMHLIKMTRNTATSRIKPPKEDWDLLLKDILELHSTIFCCVDLELCYEVYVSALLTSGDLASISLASAVLTCSDSSTVLAPVSGNGNVPHRLSYQRSLALVLNSSKEYFNSASSLIDPALELSRACLMLIQQDDTAIATELDLIASLHLLYEFDLSILPIQVRLQEDRMRLIHICLESTQHAYQEVNKLLQLAELLRVAADDSTTREALVLVAVAERALEDAPTGAVAAGAAAHRLTQGGSALGWQVAHRVATELRYGDLTSRMDLLAYSALHCTPDKIESILKARINLEAEGLQRDMTQLLSTNEVFRPPSIHDSIESNEEDYADAMTSPSVENKGLFIPIQMIDKQIKSFGNLLTDRSWQDKIKLSWFNRTPVKATDASDKPENDNLATCEEWYRSIYPEYRISQYGYCYDSFSVPDPGTVVDVTLYQTLLRYQALREHLDYNNSNTDLCKVLMQSGLAKLQYDTGLAVTHLLGAYQKQPSIPHMPHALADNQLHVMLYSLLLRNYGNDMGDQVFFTKPLELASMWTKEKSEDKEEELTRTITSCLQQLVNRVESARLREMGCNVDVSLFACNSIYQREVIFELSRNTSEEAFTLALQLARKYGIPELNVQLQHACHLLLEHNKLDHATVVASLNDPETLRSFKNNSVDVVNCLKKQVWNELLGTDHAGLLLYFGLLHNVNDQYLHGHFSANDHIKLLKKTKAASNNLDYKLLLDYTCVEELEDHILSIMKPENVAIVVKLLRSLPVIIRPQLSPSTLYSHWLVIHFFDTKANLEQEWLQQYKECSSYFNKLSCNDLMEFMKEICFNHKAIVRVPAKSRLNMMKNALNYCQLQKEKETLSTDSMRDNSWQQAEGSLTSWINFTRSFHDSRVSKIIQAAAEVPEDVWQELQMSRGEEDMMNPIAYLMLRTDLKFDTINNLVINLSEEIPILSILFYAIDNCEDNVMYAYKIGTHICDWASKEEHIDRSDELIERIKPLLPSLPAVMRLQLLTLFQAGHQNIEDNLPILTQYSCETIRSAWNDKEVPDISDDSFVFEESRKAIFDQLIVTADTWQKKKVLVDLLTYWPPFISVNGHSPCCMLLKCLLDTPSEITDNVPLLKLLLKNQSVSENEALWIADQSPKDSLEGKAWLLLLNGSEACINHVPTLFNDVAPTFDCQHLHEDLLLALLKHDLLLPLVGSSVYPVILQFIMKLEVEGSDSYNLSWLIEKLPKEKYLAEVGQLRLNKLGVPAALKGFSQSILINKKNM